MLAGAIDLAVVLAGLAVVALVVLGARAARARAATSAPPAEPVARVIPLLGATLPTVLWFAGWEASRHQATPGKRVAGLVVADTRGRPPGLGRALARAVIKLAPWELAHQAIVSTPGGLAGPESPPPAQASALIGSQLAAVANVALAIGTGRGLHDRLAGTLVRPAADGQAEESSRAP